MGNIVAGSPAERARVNNLLSKEVPHYRRAYSDRTAWFMAFLSELAYIRFNEFIPTQQKKWFVDHISNLVNENKKSSLLKLIDAVGYDHSTERTKLVNELTVLQAKLVKTFDSDGTQAMLVETGGFIALVFRGTEATSIKCVFR